MYSTELLLNGVGPWTCSCSYDFQVLHMKLQKYKEKTYEEAAKQWKTIKN